MDAEVNVDDLASYTYNARQFSNTSLGCPQPGESYAEAVTAGYQFTLIYEGQRYDYRISDNTSTDTLCSVEPVSEMSDDSLRRLMEQPVVAIAPLVGTPGTSVQVVANGFPRNIQSVIGIGVPESEYDVIRTIQTNSQGVVSTNVVIPEYFNAGEIVIVVETDDNSVRIVSFPFTITNTDDGTIGNPRVSLGMQSGVPGSALQLTATGYPPNSSVIIGVRPQNSTDFAYSLRETTDAQGVLFREITIPQNAQVNRPYIALVELESDRSYEAISPAFYPVGDEPTPILDGDEFTTADIFLIATGDAGQNGIPIGCNDSAVPVQASFTPTVAPLTAALEQLLSLNSRIYGQSGLYNAFYQSNLSVEGIDIQNGLATINLTGNLQLGGVCDTPRIEAQIRHTALQFSTVNSVNILINGEPIQ